MQSDNINELATALAKAQGQITGALKDSSNPFFKSKYADLAACWDACRKQLSDNGLSVIQTTGIRDDGHLVVKTMLAHSSGQWIAGELPIKAKDDGPQAQGSGITYARRYALAAMVGLAQIDDDAEAAQGRHDPRPEQPRPIDPKKVETFVKEFRAAFALDAPEEDVSRAVFNVHSRISFDHDTYIAVADAMTAKERTAIHNCVAAHKKVMKTAVAANGRG